MQEAKRGELVLDGVSFEAATTLLRFVLTDQAGMSALPFGLSYHVCVQCHATAEFNPPDRAVELLPIAGRTVPGVCLVGAHMLTRLLQPASLAFLVREHH
jgi:hypothetical protein